MWRSTLTLVSATLLVAGCATVRGWGGHSASVDDKQIARLQPNQLGEVNQRRAQVTAADDGVSRADVRLSDAKNELDSAKADAKVSENQVSAANSRIKGAEAKNDVAAADLARKDLTTAQGKVQTDQAHVTSAKAGVDLAEAQKKLAEKNRDLAHAQLEQSKYMALQNANDPAAKKYAPKDFQEPVTKGQQEVADAQRAVQGKQAEHQAAYSSWQQLLRQQRTASSRPPPG